MTKIFVVLAASDSVLLLAAYALGVWSKVGDGLHQSASSIYWFHFTIGLAAALLTLLVHCIIFTYFLGTGRWVKEVKLAYRLPDAPLALRTRELNRRRFTPAL